MNHNISQEMQHSSTSKHFMQAKEFSLSANFRPIKANTIQPSIRQTLFPTLLNKE